jgi:hypothetical protein
VDDTACSTLVLMVSYSQVTYDIQTHLAKGGSHRVLVSDISRVKADVLVPLNNVEDRNYVSAVK